MHFKLVLLNSQGYYVLSTLLLFGLAKLDLIMLQAKLIFIQCLLIKIYALRMDEFLKNSFSSLFQEKLNLAEASGIKELDSLKESADRYNLLADNLLTRVC